MLLAVDAGSTQTVFGLFQDGELGEHWRVATEQDRTGDELRVLLSGLLDLDSVDGILPQLDGPAARRVVRGLR